MNYSQKRSAVKAREGIFPVELLHAKFEHHNSMMVAKTSMIIFALCISSKHINMGSKVRMHPANCVTMHFLTLSQTSSKIIICLENIFNLEQIIEVTSLSIISTLRFELYKKSFLTALSHCSHETLTSPKLMPQWMNKYRSMDKK